jgi:hypothetical protein
MEPIAIPSTFCPFPLRVNPHLEALRQYSLGWAQRFYQMYDLGDDITLQRFIKGSYYKFIAYTYPIADFRILTLAHDWIVWGFILDDYFDYGPFRAEPDHVREYVNHLLSILSCHDLSDSPSFSQDPLATQLFHLWQQVLPYTTQLWRERFFQHTSDWLRAYEWEAQNRAQGIMPSERSYREKRLATGGSHTNFDFMDLAEHIELPSEVYESSLYQDLLLAANNAIIWGNDLLSLPKEQAYGEIHNFVLMVQKDQNCTIQEATNYLSNLISAEVQRFIEIGQQVVAQFPAYNQDLQRLIAGIEAWIVGSREWHCESERYSGLEEVPQGLAISDSKAA